MSRALLVVCALAACKSKQRPHDDALKKQILSGDHAPLKVPAPVIDPKALDKDAAARKLVFTQSITTLERRLDRFQIKNKITVDAPGAVGQKVYEHRLKETDRNTFTIHHEGGGAETVDWIAVDNKAFVKHGKGPWRKKPYTLQHAETLKNELAFSLADFYTLYGEQLMLTPAGDTAEGVKYSVDLTEKPKTSASAPALILKNDVEPVSLQGEIVVDKTHGSLISADLKAILAMAPMPPPQKSAADDAPPPPPQAKTNVKVRFQWSLDKADDKKPDAPTDAVEDKGFDRPEANMLSFWAAPTGATKDDKEKDEDD